MLAANAAAAPDGQKGTLDRMRDDVQKNRDKDDSDEDKPDRRRSRRRTDGVNEDDDGIDSLFSIIVAQLLGYGIIESTARVSSTAATRGLKPRAPGEALIPYVRADASTAWLIDDDIQAYRISGQVGWGALAVHAHYSKLTESGPVDDLDLVDISALFRMSFGSYVEIDIGTGGGWFGKDAGFILSTPIRVHPSEYAGVEFVPSWLFIGDTVVQRYRAVVLAGLPYVSAQAGIQVYKTESVELFGPTVGLVARF